MEYLVWIILIAGAGFMVWYGFGLLVRRPGVDSDGNLLAPQTECHLCRRKFPVTQMISRDKIAGFVNYFCADCIEGLYAEYTAKFKS